MSATHRVEQPVAWGDCDAAGVVFYPNYFRWFDAATHALLVSLGRPHRDLTARYDAIGLMLVDAQCSFTAPATFEDVLTIESTASALGARRVVVEHRITRGDTLICTGREVRVFARQTPEGVRAAPLPADLAALLGGPDVTAPATDP
ncbi:MAG: acyl-CoA thioesterase [Myxococcales bacterium]|nr:acyl-CoA thioesterase [Myxococcales bacterium]